MYFRSLFACYFKGFRLNSVGSGPALPAPVLLPVYQILKNELRPFKIGVDPIFCKCQDVKTVSVFLVFLLKRFHVELKNYSRSCRCWSFHCVNGYNSPQMMLLRLRKILCHNTCRICCMYRKIDDPGGVSCLVEVEGLYHNHLVLRSSAPGRSILTSTERWRGSITTISSSDPLHQVGQYWPLLRGGGALSQPSHPRFFCSR
jgi:hypothetical protein